MGHSCGITTALASVDSTQRGANAFVKFTYLSPLTHNHLLPGICDDRSIEEQLLGRVVTFARSSAVSSNTLLRIAFGRALLGSLSPLSNSLSFISGKYCLERNFFVYKEGSLPVSVYDDDVHASVIRDFSITAHHSFGDDRSALRAIIELRSLNFVRRM